jgi:hypothetical protein
MQVFLWNENNPASILLTTTKFYNLPAARWAQKSAYDLQGNAQPNHHYRLHGFSRLLPRQSYLQ